MKKERDIYRQKPKHASSHMHIQSLNLHNFLGRKRSLLRLKPSVQMSPFVDANATRHLPKEMREKREGIGNIGGGERIGKKKKDKKKIEERK